MGKFRRRRIPSRRGVVVLVAVATLGSATVARAAFSTTTAAAHALSSATLQPASHLTGTTACNGLLSAKATLNWTATPSTFATGYTVTRYRGTTLESTVSVTPRTTVTLTQTGLSTGTTYTWHLWAVKASWSSTEVTVTKTTPAVCL